MTRHILLLLIELYQFIGRAGIFPSVCRFEPSCSAYAQEAITAYGAWKGSKMAIRRILRCHPAHPGGQDPVIATTDKGVT